MNDGLERILKEAQNGLFNILSQNLPGGTKETNEKPQSGHKLHFLMTNMSIILLTYMFIASPLKFTVRGSLLSRCSRFHYQYRPKLSSTHNSQHGYTLYFKSVMWSWRLNIWIARHDLPITNSL